MTKSFKLRKINSEKADYVNFEEICVLFTHFHPSKDGCIPILVKRAPHAIQLLQTMVVNLISASGGREVPPYQGVADQLTLAC
jgi:arginine/lysine/ornithine decarboxylase